MEGNDYHCHSGSSSPADPLAPLSDCAPGSLCSSWGSDESLGCSSANIINDVNQTIGCHKIDWQQRCVCLQTELFRFQNQADRMKNTLHEKLSKMELRVTDAESRAKEAEMKLRVMEEKLKYTNEWGLSVTNCEAIEQDPGEAISKLVCQVEEQRQLRLQDAKFVEAKAARIKEWVTSKLRDLEAENQLLREQNFKYHEELDLIRRHMAQASSKQSLETNSAVNEIASSSPLVISGIVDFSRSFGYPEPVYAQVDHQSKKHTSPMEVFPKKKYHSAGSVSAISQSTNIVDVLPDIGIHSLATLPSHARSKSVCIGESDLTHDYAEIYTPNRNKVSWGSEVKPPTPPLHRFPSWESRIYQVANQGLSNLATCSSNQSFPIIHPESHVNCGFCNIRCPVYVTVKGRASLIRSSPFSGDSSDDSSDGEDLFHNNPVTVSPITNSSADNTDNSMSSSSPSKSHSHKTYSNLSPMKSNSLGSPFKNTSFESGISDDYAIPPDAVSCKSDLFYWSTLSSATVIATSFNKQKLTINELCEEKCGSLAKLGGKLKTWRKRWFHLSSTGLLRYWKSENDIHRKPRGEIFINELCKIVKSEAGTTFELSTPKKAYYLTADSVNATEEWIKALVDIQAKNATKLLLDKNNCKPTLQGWITKVHSGHAKKYWCTLIGKTFLYFKSPSESSPSGQINMKETKVEQVEHVSDSESDENSSVKPRRCTIGIFPSSQAPTYLLMPSQQELDSWLYHLTIVSGGNTHVGTQFEQLIQKLMDIDGDFNNVLWKHPLLLHAKDAITTNLTTLSCENLVSEALKLFKCCQLFMSAAVEAAGIDYHVILAQNALQQCLKNWQLQGELLCILIKQTSPLTAHKVGGPKLSKLRHRSLFACDTAGSPTIPNIPSGIDACKSNPPNFVFLQGWQLLALAVSLFVPKDHRILWYLKCHISKIVDVKSECGKYAAYCERALQRTIRNGNREMKPSRMEVLSILLKNPYHHSLPHSIPVHFLNGSYQVVGFDGSTTVTEFLKTLTHDIACRESVYSGFTLFSDDPIEKNLEHYIDPRAKLCDIISKWETALREKGSGKFENTKVIQLVYKNRLYFKQSAKNETDREKMLMCFQVNHQIINGRFPLTKELAVELAALMTQIDFGEFCSDKSHGSGCMATSTNSSKDLIILQAIDKFYPYRYRENLSPEALKELQTDLQKKWMSLKGRSSLDCIRIYLTCTRKWPYFGASLFQAKWKQGENKTATASVVWLAACEDHIALLELGNMQLISSYIYSQILTFGGSQDDFMMIVNGNDNLRSLKLLFSMSKPKILELTLVIADYMNALGQRGMPLSGSFCKNNIQPDILKTIPDQQLSTLE